MTMYIYCTIYEKRLTIKDIYNFTSVYLSDYFPNMPSYVAICRRISRLAAAFQELFNHLSRENISSFEDLGSYSLIDSVPVITCSGKRSGKVAKEITDKGYCSTKSMYYYGVKLHVLAFK